MDNIRQIMYIFTEISNESEEFFFSIVVSETSDNAIEKFVEFYFGGEIVMYVLVNDILTCEEPYFYNNRRFNVQKIYSENGIFVKEKSL